MCVLTCHIQVAEAWSGTVYIRSDGSIEPLDAPVQRNETLYTLTANIQAPSPPGPAGIVIERDNIVVDGAGYWVYGAVFSDGIDVEGRRNVTIRNVKLYNCVYGIYLSGSSNCRIVENKITTGDIGYGIGLSDSSNCQIAENKITSGIGICIALGRSSNNSISGNNLTSNMGGLLLFMSSNNSISGNNLTSNMGGLYLLMSSNNSLCGNKIENNGWVGIELNNCSKTQISQNNISKNNLGMYIYDSWNNTLRNNTLTDNQRGFAIWGESFLHYANDVDTSNTIDGKPIYYWINESDRTVPLDAGQVILVNCTKIEVQGLKLAKNGMGIILSHTTNSTLSQNTLTDNNYGIHLSTYSKNNTISGNHITKNGPGVQLDRSLDNTIFNNNITDNGEGVLLENSFGNSIFDNNLTDNGQGILLFESSNNTLTHNDMSGFGVFGSALSHYINSVDVSNVVDGKPIYYFINQSKLMINPDIYPEVGYLGLVNCNNATVQGMNLTNNGQGLLLAFTNDSKITNNNLEGNGYGCYLCSSYNDIIARNRLERNSYVTFFLSSSHNNSFFENTVLNTQYCVTIKESANNKFYHNNFYSNFFEKIEYYSEVEDYPNIWDNGYPSGGNYWNDYHGNDSCRGSSQNETGSDGIGDTPCGIPGFNSDSREPMYVIDYYPLMGPWTIEGVNVTVTPSHDVAITFGNVTSAGITTLNISQMGPDPPSGFKLATETPTYYDIKTTANYTGPIQIKIAYNDAGLTRDQENNLRLMHWNNTLQRWIDITKYVDTENNLIYGESIAFSIFAIMLSPNMAVKNITVSKTIVGQGYSITLNVTVENQGGYAETLITVYANTTATETQTVTLTSGNSTTLTFTWDTTGFAKGNYTIWAYAWPVSNETDTADNTCTDGWVIVAMVGDINGPDGWPDGQCDMLYDIRSVAKIFGVARPDPRYNPNYDINGDGVIDMINDIRTVAKHFGEIDP
jgi:parallel beta-helix repeat protein